MQYCQMRQAFQLCFCCQVATAREDLMYCLCCAGCSDLTFNITTGLPDAAGAKYVLNMGFKPGAFLFLSETEGNM